MASVASVAFVDVFFCGFNILYLSIYMSSHVSNLCPSIPAKWLIAALKLMGPGVWSVVQFVLEGSRSNFFGWGCPAYCYQPSYSSWILIFTLGLISGIVLSLASLWTLWTFFGQILFPVAPPAGSVPRNSRYSVLAEYLNEPRAQRPRHR